MANAMDGPCRDRRVRQALISSLDREALSQQLFAGRQQVAQTNVNPLDWVHTDDVPIYTEDLEGAAALLGEAGWTEMQDGVRHNAAGEPLQLTIMTTAGNRTRELVQQVLQSMWKRVGIDVVSALSADPKATSELQQAISPWPKSSPGYFRDVHARLKRFVESGQLGSLA